MRKLLFVIFSLVPLAAFAQEGVGATSNPEPINWVAHLGAAINMVLIPILYQVLKNYLIPKMPSWVKSAAAVLSGSLLVMLGQLALEQLGVVIDFSSIIELLTTGAGAGAASAIAFGMGKKAA